MKIKVTYYIDKKVIERLRKLPRDVCMSEYIEDALEQRLDHDKAK